MKKIIISLYTIAITFTSYAQDLKKDATYDHQNPITNYDSIRKAILERRASSMKSNSKKVSTFQFKVDTSYFKYKNINYSIEKILYDDGSVSQIIKNIDVKYEGDEVTRNKSNHEGWGDRDIKDYYDRTLEVIQRDVHTIFFKYIKENLTVLEKKRLLDSTRKLTLNDLLGLRIVLEKDASFVDISWRISTPSSILDVFKNENIAELDMSVRKNLIVAKSGLDSQRRVVIPVDISRKKMIEFLEKELEEK